MRMIDADNLIEFFTNLEKAGARSMVFADAKRFVNEQPTAYDVDKVVERLENCADSTTFRYDKETGVLYEVEADVWARIADGTEVEIPIKSNGIE